MALIVQCGICLEYSTSKEQGHFVTTQCGHIYHNVCLEESAKRQTLPRCPACRKPVPAISLVKLHGMCPAGAGSDVNENEEAVKVKAILLGDSGTGKSSLLYAFDTGRKVQNITITNGCDLSFKRLQFRGKMVNLSIWDCGGQDRFRAIIPNYLRGSHAVCLFYDVTDPKTFRNVNVWVDLLREHGMQDKSIILIGNKVDLKKDRRISTAAGQDEANRHKFYFIETSAMDLINVEAAFRTVVAAALEKILESPNIDDSEVVTLIDPTTESSRCCC